MLAFKSLLSSLAIKDDSAANNHGVKSLHAWTENIYITELWKWNYWDKILICFPQIFYLKAVLFYTHIHASWAFHFPMLLAILNVIHLFIFPIWMDKNCYCFLLLIVFSLITSEGKYISFVCNLIFFLHVLSWHIIFSSFKNWIVFFLLKYMSTLYMIEVIYLSHRLQPYFPFLWIIF